MCCRCRAYTWCHRAYADLFHVYNEHWTYIVQCVKQYRMICYMIIFSLFFYAYRIHPSVSLCVYISTSHTAQNWLHKMPTKIQHLMGEPQNNAVTGTDHFARRVRKVINKNRCGKNTVKMKIVSCMWYWINGLATWEFYSCVWGCALKL